MEIDDLIVQQNSMPPSGKGSTRTKKKKNIVVRQPQPDEDEASEDEVNSVDKLAAVIGVGRRPRGSQDENIVSPSIAIQKPP